MKKITLTISSRDYTISLDDDFAQAFERDWQEFMDGKRFLDPKELLNAFVKKSYDSYTKDNAISGLSQHIAKRLKE